MSEMFAIAPVTLLVRLTVTKASANGFLGGVTSVDVLSANGDADARFYGFASNYGGLVLNYKEGGRPAKPVKADKADKAVPRALSAVQTAQIPANGTKSARGKPKYATPKAPEVPEVPATPDMQAIVAAVLAAMRK